VRDRNKELGVLVISYLLSVSRDEAGSTAACALCTIATAAISTIAAII